MIDYAVWVAQAEARLAEIDQERGRLLSIIEHARALMQVAGHIADDAQGAGPRLRIRSRPPVMGSVMDTTRTAVAKILDTLGQPLETRDLVPLVKEEGVPIGGKDDVATLSARLSNSNEHFKLHKGVGWWFINRPLPGVFEDFEEAGGQSEEAKPPASKQETEGGESDTAAIDELTS